MSSTDPSAADLRSGRRADGLLVWIRQTRSLFDRLRLPVDVGPIVDGETVAGRWIAEGSTGAASRAANAPAGIRVRFHGNDLWRT
jgi:hypothetical protein